MIPDADMLDDAAKLLWAGGDFGVAKRQNVLVRKGNDEPIWREVGKPVIPKGVNQNQARVEIAIEDYDEAIRTGVNHSASVVQHHRQVGDRVSMELGLGHAFCPQMPPLDVLKLGSMIDDISDQQFVSEVGKNRRFFYR